MKFRPLFVPVSCIHAVLGIMVLFFACKGPPPLGECSNATINDQVPEPPLPQGGILVTCSCSAHISLQDFRFMLSEAAARAGRTVQIVETFTHGIDHPNLVAFTEGEYLKCLFCLVR